MKKIGMILLALILLGCSSKEQSREKEVHVYTRDASSGTREAFEKSISLETLTENAIEVTSNGDMSTKVSTDSAGIGYVSLSTDFSAYQIKALQFEGVEPSVATVLDGTYQMQRPFSYVTRQSGDFVSDEKEQLVLAFLDFLSNSIEGKLAIQSAGGIVDTDAGIPWAELAGNHPITNQDNSNLTLTTAGSTSVSKTLQAVLEMFQPMAGNFQFVTNQTGSSDGYKRTLGAEKDGPNAADIGFASRQFKEEEDTTVALQSGIYCIDAVVVVVHESNSLVNLTKESLSSIFAGDIKNFSEIE